jgi:hypothetical protein
MNQFTLRKPVLISCCALAVYYIIMELYYVYFITVEYLAYGFYMTPDIKKYIEAKFIFVVIIFFSILISKVSEFIYSILVFFIVFFLIPTLITYAFTDRPPGPLYSTVLLILVLGIVSVNKLKIPTIQTYKLSYGLFMFLILLTVLPILWKFGIYFNLKNVLLEEVYATRNIFSANSTLGIDYLYNWLVKALIPIGMIFFLVHKRIGYAVISLVLLFYLYIISGNKIVYITLFVMLFFYFVGNDYVEKAKYFLFALIAGLLVLPLVDYYVLGNHSMKGIFVMRMLFFPSQLNYYYFDFFKDSPLFFAESNFFKFFFSYPFERPIGFVISTTYFNFPEMNANNGIISDGYMNLGYPGIALYIFIIAAIFLYFNSIEMDSRYLGIFFVMIFLFLSAPMLSMFVTSGLWILFLCSLTLMRKKADELV